MNIKYIRTYLLICSFAFILQPPQGLTQQNPDAAKASVQHSPMERDGQHDFDFEAGAWKVHLKKLLHPLTGSSTWNEFEGTAVGRKIWNGRANLDEFEADGPTGHIEGLTLRLYNPQTRQWSLYWANSKAGTIGGTPNIGEFKNGRGEFFCQDTLNGRTILVRYAWSDITPNSAHFEQSFSDDGGKTWEVNWISQQTRMQDDSKIGEPKPNVQPAPTERDGQHDFDFEIGAWKIHLKRLDGRLVGATTWVEFEGTSVTRKVWNGRADLEEFEVDSPTGHIEGLTLRLYNPQTHLWSLYWANSKDGILGVPTIGEFKNGRGEFFDMEPSGPNGRNILLRFIWSGTTTNSPHFEQSFSDDGGKTWEVNWITDQTRVKDESVKAH